MSQALFQVGDAVVLKGCPFDEQIATEAMRYGLLKDKTQIVTEVKASGWRPDHYLVKTDQCDEWIDAGWYEPKKA